MKHRILTLLLAAPLLFSLGACGKTQPASSTPGTGVTGGWEVVPAQAAPLPESAQTAFDKATAAQTDGEYTPVALLSTQLVAGTNYCVFCQITPKASDTPPYWALVYIYADLQGNAEVTNVYDLDIPRHWAPAK